MTEEIQKDNPVFETVPGVVLEKKKDCSCYKCSLESSGAACELLLLPLSTFTACTSADSQSY